MELIVEASSGWRGLKTPHGPSGGTGRTLLGKIINCLATRMDGWMDDALLYMRTSLKQCGALLAVVDILD